MTEALFAGQGLAILVAAIAAFTDARSGQIPNWLTLPPILLGPLVYGLIGGPWMAAFAVLAALLCGLVPYVLFRRGAMGGGDVKLFAAIGALAGISAGIEAQLLAFIIASLFAMVRLTWQGKLGRTLKGSLFIVINPLLPKAKRYEVTPEVMTQMRLGIPALLGTLMAVVSRLPLAAGTPFGAEL